MDLIKRLEPLWLGFVLAGALNWAVVSLFDTNVVAELFGTGTVSDVLYVVMGVSALMLMPRFLSEFHFGDRARPHGA
jgi:uncharacterized membrane protein YuzA (DUF378 family)